MCFFFFYFKELEDNKSVGERKRKVGIKWRKQKRMEHQAINVS